LYYNEYYLQCSVVEITFLLAKIAVVWWRKDYQCGAGIATSGASIGTEALICTTRFVTTVQIIKLLGTETGQWTRIWMQFQSSYNPECFLWIVIQNKNGRDFLEGAMQYGMNAVFGKFYMLRISNKEGVRGEKLTVVTCYI